jgi:hypothetical protein
MLYLDLDSFFIAVEEERRSNRKYLRLLPIIYKSLLSKSKPCASKSRTHNELTGPQQGYASC